MFERILYHPLIDVAVSTSFDEVRDALRWDHLVWTGPIDDFYDRRFGALPYRSLRFEWETVDTPAGSLLQPVAQLNYPDEAVPHTRSVEYRHITGERADVTRISREYPSDEGEPFYPVPAPEHRELYRRYAELAERDPAVTFVGRLARYQYLNMDQVTAQALVTFERVRDQLAARDAA
jgi:UDP-galactopyranose mutase